MKKDVNKKEVIPAGMEAANASIEYRPKKIRSVNSITVVAAMLSTRGRLILRISLYLPGVKKAILITIFLALSHVFSVYLLSLKRKFSYHMSLVLCK